MAKALPLEANLQGQNYLMRLFSPWSFLNSPMRPQNKNNCPPLVPHSCILLL
jgi:hypothetical protein